ncbi:hypothetical protein V1477_002748 [Vespula maculifrons]|uniref:Uncharacterized protein n=3 Tax=Vespula TaxID=7451 RepID=A0A834NUU0_VESGE|nr:hypothetical protein HZH66_000949 [Vespula vulgaris]KAF7418370.1 hypothetical protein HZH68_001023 [Vespula germanica]
MSEDEEEHSGCGKTSERRRAIKSISYQAPREITSSLHKSLNRLVAAAFPPASASMDAERRRVARAEGIELSTELEGATPKDKLAA